MLAPYGQSLALLTDLYQLTMAYGYWKEGLAEREAIFHQYFRTAPFGGTFAIAAGLETALEWLKEFQFSEDDREYLATLSGSDGKPLFERAFLAYLGDLKFRCDLEAVREGSVVFPREPLLRVRGPLLQCQLIETALLNIVNFQTLIATKALRVCLAAGDDAVLEFGLRRAPGIDGGLSASRAAYIGGCAATSNVLAGKLLGIPVRGTHAHSWVMSFDSEIEAFEAYARTMPNNCVFLVDTFDTIEGIKHAVSVGKKLRERGHKLIGIRLDSGDLASLSIEAARLLDEAGWSDAAIVASNDLDEAQITSLKEQGARINVWGVGTRLVSGGPEGVLGGVYKLSALKDAAGNWRGKLKLSEDSTKASMPGMPQVRRYVDGGSFLCDLIYDELEPPKGEWIGVDPQSRSIDLIVDRGLRHEDLLQPVLRRGEPVGPLDSLEEARGRARSQLSKMPAGLTNHASSETLPVFIERGLSDRCAQLAANLGA